MTDAVTISLIGAVGSFAATCLGILNNAIMRRTRDEITVLEKNTDGIKDELVRVTGNEAFARGLKEGHAEAAAPEHRAARRTPKQP